MYVSESSYWHSNTTYKLQLYITRQEFKARPFEVLLNIGIGIGSADSTKQTSVNRIGGKNANRSFTIKVTA